MKKINIYGGSGSGKSTLAALLCFKMKIKNLNVDLIFDQARENHSEQVDFLIKTPNLDLNTLTNVLDRDESHYFVEAQYQPESDREVEEQIYKISSDIKDALRQTNIEFHILNKSAQENVDTILMLERII